MSQIKVSMIAAMSNNRVIGLNNKMPWHLPADLQFFKKMTLGSPIIMGRKTYDSIGRPLPGRLNIVLSKDEKLKIDGCTVVHTFMDALDAAKGSEEVFITGGAHLYNNFLDKAKRLYLTLVDGEFEGDTYFPDYTQYQWKEINRVVNQADENNPYPYTFLTLERCR